MEETPDQSVQKSREWTRKQAIANLNREWLGDDVVVIDGQTGLELTEPIDLPEVISD